MKVKSREIKQKVEEEGYIHANVMFEVLGNPKELVQKSIAEYLQKLKSMPEEIMVLKETVEVPEEQEDMWSTFAEVEMLLKSLERLTWLCVNYMPASIEIMAPETAYIKARDITNWLNDLLAKLHEITTLSHQVGQQNKIMLKSINALFRNSILVSIDSGIKDSKTIAQKIGVSENDLEKVFEAMIKEGKVKKEGKGYSRV